MTIHVIESETENEGLPGVATVASPEESRTSCRNRDLPGKPPASERSGGRVPGPHTVSGPSPERMILIPAESGVVQTPAHSAAARTQGHTAVVLSTTGRRTDFDWCGSFAHAIRIRSERIGSGQYERVCVRRIRRRGSGRARSRHWLYVSSALMEWKHPSAEHMTLASRSDEATARS